jgi:hypothetical protein
MKRTFGHLVWLFARVYLLDQIAKDDVICTLLCVFPIGTRSTGPNTFCCAFFALPNGKFKSA